jgi:hypothetical protein
VSLTGSETSSSSTDTNKTPTQAASSVIFSVAETGDCNPDSEYRANEPPSPCLHADSRNTGTAKEPIAGLRVEAGVTSLPFQMSSETVIAEAHEDKPRGCGKHRKQFYRSGHSCNDSGEWVDTKHFA